MQQQPGSGFRLIVRRGPQPNQIHELNSDVITLGAAVAGVCTIIYSQQMQIPEIMSFPTGCEKLFAKMCI